VNRYLDKLQPYPFARLAQLKSGIQPPPGTSGLDLSIGEPRHPAPHFIAEALISHMHGLASYPKTAGSMELRQAIGDWLPRRFGLPAGSIDPERHVLPVNGTREALFAVAQAVVDGSAKDPVVLMPNPFYQIYEGAALLAGARPVYINCTVNSGYLPDFDSVSAQDWANTQLLYLCSPGNPTGAVLDVPALQELIGKAQQYGFVIAADECYSEIYQAEDDPPAGLLQAAAAMGNTEFDHCLVFHSLSKRSNVPGLRSGFVAGNAALIERFLQYRTYHGCAMPPPTQAASRCAWSDEAHVVANREAYREKFAAVRKILGPVTPVRIPPAAFYLWLETPIADTDFARRLYQQHNITVLPGRFLSRAANGANPGEGHVRVALVASLNDCIDAARRTGRFMETL